MYLEDVASAQESRAVIERTLLAYPGKGKDNGKVEGLVKYARANFTTPLPTAASFDALNVTGRALPRA